MDLVDWDMLFAESSDPPWESDATAHSRSIVPSIAGNPDASSTDEQLLVRTNSDAAAFPLSDSNTIQDHAVSTGVSSMAITLESESENQSFPLGIADGTLRTTPMTIWTEDLLHLPEDSLWIPTMPIQPATAPSAMDLDLNTFSSSQVSRQYGPLTEPDTLLVQYKLGDQIRSEMKPKTKLPVILPKSQTKHSSSLDGIDQ